MRVSAQEKWRQKLTKLAPKVRSPRIILGVSLDQILLLVFYYIAFGAN